MSVSREALGENGVWLVMRCDTIGCDTKPVAYPAFWSAEDARDHAMFWSHDDARDRDICPACERWASEILDFGPIPPERTVAAKFNAIPGPGGLFIDDMPLDAWRHASIHPADLTQ